jgi:uncharacterized protein YcnI
VAKHIIKAMLNVHEKVDEKNYEEKNEDEKDDIDDADKIVRLVMKNIISKIYDEFIVWIRFNENSDKLPHDCNNTYMKINVNALWLQPNL